MNLIFMVCQSTVPLKLDALKNSGYEVLPLSSLVWPYSKLLQEEEDPE